MKWDYTNIFIEILTFLFTIFINNLIEVYIDEVKEN